MTEPVCPEPRTSPTWGVMDLIAWKMLPDRFGGGVGYIQRFKDAWVRHNRQLICALATEHRMPPELLAGVCWIEVGGDPEIIDSVAFEVRAFDWSGPNWVDRNLTITNAPQKTSFGPVSIQLRTAAQTIGLDVNKMTAGQLRSLANCLQKDVYNLKLVAQHLRQLIDHDRMQPSPPTLTMDAVRIVGARYNRGTGLSLEQIKKNTSYGNFIVKFWPRFSALLEEASTQ